MEDPPPTDWALFHAEVVALTAECARLSSKEQAELIQPIPRRPTVKVWLARDPSFSTFDPVATALEPMVELGIHNRLPAQAELNVQKAVIVIARNTGTHGLTPVDVQHCLGHGDPARHPVLYLCGKGSPTTEHPSITFANWPIPVSALAGFISGLK
jgi:hypothetical protein